MTIDCLFNKIEKRRDILNWLMMSVVGNDLRYKTLSRYFDKISEKIVVDCVIEYIDDKESEEGAV